MGSMIILFIIGLILGAFAIIFAAQNVTAITVVFLAWRFEGSLALILAMAVASGVLICALLSWPDVIRKRFQIAKLREEKQGLKDELAYKEKEVEEERSKLVANNAYIDGVEEKAHMLDLKK